MPQRLAAPANTRVPADADQDPRRKRVFVCSMADAYGRWVPREWIEQVHGACIANQQWDYLLLTKFPSRYLEFLDQLPPTAWLGTSVDEQKRVRIAEQAFRQITGVRKKWLSLEPLKEPLRFTVLRCLVWVETTSGGRTEVELSGDEIDDGGEVSNGAIAASLCLGGLYEAVDSLDETIGDLAVEPA